ncbi:iron siderophore-binding protein [Chitinimonas prasina]|uniref:Iron siderophore-binding protein n=1 Tax=Chitinimonas prasina TaxID=1434937 RepID=A0ABQ5YB82_9NEIS|nr:iron-siderophore ABC transporter substrate-binding protein [Chitinimonas prasina]GLR12216.1 iron siderophore-binding protein [Chitinimonas prasina]
MKTDRRHFLAAAGGLALSPLLARAHRRTPRVLTLEYHATEMALALGIVPVGVADPKGYARWVGVGKDQLRHVASVGNRQQPSIEAMARLQPDLIIAVGFRHASLRGLFERIAPTLMLPNPEQDGLAGVYSDYRSVGAALGLASRAEQALQQLDAQIATERLRLQAAGWAGKPLAILQGLGGVSQMWAFAGNSVPGGIQKALGLTGPWMGITARQGVDTKTVEDLLSLDTTLALLSDGRPGASKSTIWQQVPAVKQGRLIELPAGLWPFGGPVSTPNLVHALSSALLRVAN